MRQWTRIRALLDRWFQALVIVCILMALTGGWLTYKSHINPGTTTEQRTVSSWSTTGAVSHSAIVQSPNPVYSVGKTFRDRDIYFSETTPVLDGKFLFTYRASESGNLDVEIITETVLRSFKQTNDSPIEVWRRTERIGNKSIDSLSSGETVTIPFSVNVSRLQNEAKRVNEGLGNPPGENRISVQTTIEFKGTVNDQQVNRSETLELFFEFDRGIYRPIANVSTEQYETSRSVEVSQEPSPLESTGGSLLLFVGFLGSVGLITARRRNRLALTEAERAWLEFEDNRNDFDEWITTFELPEHVYEMPQANAETLADLVSFAIDTNNTVIENPSGEAYYVIHDGYCYTYEPPYPGIETQSPLKENGYKVPGDDETPDEADTKA